MYKSFSEKILDEYDELEAKYQEACDKISQYEEENRILREQRTKLVEDNDNLKDENFKCSYRLERLGQALEERGIYCRWFAAELEWHLYEGKTMDDLKQHYEKELRIREKEKDEKDKLIDELHEKIEVLEKENEELKAKNRNLQIRTNMTYGVYGLYSKNGELIKKIEALKKENKELKDTLIVDREFGKYVGKRVAYSIQEGWKNGTYELHPYTRFDIHVEETKNTSMSSNRYSIPNVVVMFNNTQTEMERDTAQHECEELNEKVDRLWRVNDELNRKIKELKKENKELKATLAVCAVDANTAKNLCNGIVSKAKHTRNNKE